MFKKHNFKTFWCNPNDPNFDLFKFLGEIDLHILKLREKNAVNKALHILKLREKNAVKRQLIKLLKTLKILAVTKLKGLKGYAKNILPKYKEWKTKNQKLYR